MEGEVMKKDVKDLWVAALRSGDYPQTRNVLHRTLPVDDAEGFCCWGVLCELAVKAGEPIKVKESDGTMLYDGEGEMPPDSVYEWAGIRFDRDRDPMTVIDCDSNDVRGLADLNDAGVDFDTIANLIETQVTGE